MTAINIDNKVIISYLLGRLDEEREEGEILQIEERLYTEDALYEQIQETESELIDRYLDGHLEGDDKARFESYFLQAPERKERLEFNRALRVVTDEYLDSLEKPLPPVAKGAGAGASGIWARFISWWESLAVSWQLGAAAAACVLFLMVGIGFMSWRNAALRAELDEASVASRELKEKTEVQAGQIASLRREYEDERNKSTSLQQELDRLMQGAAAIFSTTLGTFIPGIVSKGGDEIQYQKLTIPTDAPHAQLQFAPRSNRFERYNIALYRINDEGQTDIQRFLNRPAPAKEGQPLSIRIPAKLLTKGRYALELTGVEEGNKTESIGQYRFEVRRTP